METLETLETLDGELTKQEKQERLHISRILDIARDYLEREQYDLATAFVDIAKDYDCGKYRAAIEGMELHLEVVRAFETYDQEMLQYAS